MSTPQSGIELLSPAGDLASFYAAIHNGADAVYLGAASFGARASAGFDEEALLKFFIGQEAYNGMNAEQKKKYKFS